MLLFLNSKNQFFLLRVGMRRILVKKLKKNTSVRDKERVVGDIGVKEEGNVKGEGEGK